MRAMESEEDGRLYSDPLAGDLAGPTAMAQVRELMKVGAGRTSRQDGTQMRLR